MRQHRFTIAGILGFVVLLAVGLAALREATDAWDSAIFGAALCALTCAVLLAVQRRDRGRAFWLGCALFGSVYLGASLVPSVAGRLPTTLGLAYLDSKLSDRAELTYIKRVVAFTDGDYVVGTLDGKSSVNAPGSVRLWNAAAGKPISLVRGTAENFVRIGHSLAALVVGFLAGLLSRRLDEANAAGRAAEPCVRAPDGP